MQRKIEQAAPAHRKVWYLADGVYSMFGDPAPVAELAALLASHPQPHLYMDDSHGIGWSGRHGHGPTSDVLAGHDRVIVIGSLNKSFAGAGAALVLPTAETHTADARARWPVDLLGPGPAADARRAAGIRAHPPLARHVPRS